MADFESSYRRVLEHEGGYVNDPDDPGGETYKGVARKMNSKWAGWVRIDMLKRQGGFPANLERDADLQEMVRDFYEVNYWDKVKGDDIANQEVAFYLFEFAVNAGVATSSTLAQLVVGANKDGVIGGETVKAINAYDPEKFIALFTVAKIARYVNIVKNRPTSKKYFYGWVRRALGEN